MVAMDLNTETIYIHLLNEGTPVMRPTQGLPLGGDLVYKVLPTTNYDPSDENWEFPPGSVVQCVKENKDGDNILIAKKRI